MSRKNKPAKFLVWMLRRVLPGYADDTNIGDFEEEYAQIAANRGRPFANFWLALNILKSVPPFVADAIRFKLVMFKNYALITWRNMRRHKTYSFINITGLAVGLICCLLITLWILDEHSYDRFHENRDRLYRVVVNLPSSRGIRKIVATPPPLGQVLKNDFPEIVETTRLSYWGSVPLRSGNKSFNETNMIVVEPSFFDLFTFPFIKGEGAASLNTPNSALISERRAESFFGNEDPIGKIIQVDSRFEYTVRGVFQDIPYNTHIRQFDFVLPWSHLNHMNWYEPNSWGMNSYRTYVLLGEKASFFEVNQKIKKIIQQYSPGAKTEILLEPISDIHLRSHYRLSPGLRGIDYVYIFSIVAVFILLIACFNFMNLTTAISFNRAKEIGMRKTLGATRRHMIVQFLGESMFVTFLALGLALVIICLILPEFNKFTGKQITIRSLFNWQAIIGLVGINLFAACVAGSYPALFLSSFRPVHVFKNVLQKGKKKSGFRRILVILQFSISVILIIGAIVVYSQLDYVRNRKIGWERENLIGISLSKEMKKSYDILRTELLKHPRILNVTAAYSDPTSFETSSSSVNWEGKNPEEIVHVTGNLVDYDFLDTLNIELAEGRPFSKKYSTDATQAFLINETLAGMMEAESPVGAKFSFFGREGRVIGVMKDFHFHSLHSGIGPLAMGIGSEDYWNHVLIKIHQDSIPMTLTDINKIWKNIFPHIPFAFRFMEEQYERHYKPEMRMGKLINVFAGLAVFIACLGLIGLTSFAIEQRKKEICIRKVLGASPGNMILILGKEFMLWVLIANVIAWPLAYFVMSGWLRNFAYKIGMRLEIFVFSSFLAFAVAISAVIFQFLREATSNPVDSLRYE
ncbi:MAG: ABC transporter permease [Candidatus Aminicenantes bacterium]|nr:ABC transporter permease [Candidatus Aminicenantes bacterium]